MSEHDYAVIMAGGGGTRLWPLSRKRTPKQMLRLIEERSLFQMAVDRLDGLFDPSHILVVTISDQALELQKQCPQIPEENFIIEPCPKGTASVIGLAAVALQYRDPQAVMAVLTSDHFIGNEELFRMLLRIALGASRNDYLVTLGISPTYAATSYGYIQQGKAIDRIDGVDIYQVLKFKEKPDELHAQLMLAGSDHTWNSGMFIWKTERILQEFERQMPDLAGSLKIIRQAWGDRQFSSILEREWQALKSETIDYGIMERALDVVVIPAGGLRWSDVGSWDSLFDFLPADSGGNIVIGGKHFGLDTRQSMVYVNEEHRLIVTIGVRDLIVVDTGDVLLICAKEEAQKVRHVVNALKEQGEDYI